MKTCFIFIITAGMFTAGRSAAQSFFQPLNTPYLLAPAYTGNETDHSAVSLQPAALGRVQQTMFWSQAQRRYGLAALSHYQGLLAVAAGPGAFGFHWYRAGDAAYRESGAGLAYGRKLGAVAETGIRLQYQSQQFQGYGATGSLVADLGILLRAGADWQAGFALLQMGRHRGNTEGALYRPVTVQFGTGYRFSNALQGMLLLEKTSERPVAVQGGFCYALTEFIGIRAGYGWPQGLSWAGVQWQRGALQTHLAVQVHPQLGFSPALLFQYAFKKREP